MRTIIAAVVASVVAVLVYRYLAGGGGGTVPVVVAWAYDWLGPIGPAAIMWGCSFLLVRVLLPRPKPTAG